MRRTVGNLVFQFVPGILSKVEVSTLWRPLDFFHTNLRLVQSNLSKSHLYGAQRHYHTITEFGLLVSEGEHCNDKAYKEILYYCVLPNLWEVVGSKLTRWLSGYRC